MDNPLTHFTFNPWKEVHGTRRRAADNYWKQPLRWDREAKAAGERRRVFCASLADVFEDWGGPIVDSVGTELCRCHDCGEVMFYNQRECSKDCRSDRAPRKLSMNDMRADLFALIDRTPNLDWLLLTKRPENIREMWRCKYGNEQCEDDGCEYRRRENVWLGTSVSNQQTADKQIPELLKCRDLAPVLFVSAEPLLGPIDFGKTWTRYVESEGHHLSMTWLSQLNECPNCDSGENITDTGFDCSYCQGTCCVPGIDWIIVGGESGHGARPCDIAWIRSIRDQCHAAGVACFVKQLGARIHATNIIDPIDQFPGSPTFRQGPGPDTAVLKLIDRKGGDIAEFPADLRIRQFPTGASPCPSR